MKLKNLIIETIQEPIYVGDLLEINVWNRYKGVAGVSNKNRIGYAIVVQLSPKSEKEKHYTFRIIGWYRPISAWNTINNQWKTFLENNFDSKDVIKKVTLEELPKEIQSQAIEFKKRKQS